MIGTFGYKNLIPYFKKTVDDNDTSNFLFFSFQFSDIAFIG
jgi:hypothetical protein